MHSTTSFVLGTVIASTYMFFMAYPFGPNKPELDKLKAQAIEYKYAEWVSDEKGKPTFKFIKPN